MPRESHQEDESSGSAMKIVAAILAVICAGLGFGLYKSSSGTGAQAEKDAATIATLNTNMNELRTRLVFEQGNAGVAHSNQQHLLDRRTAALVNTSNHLVQTSLLLGQTRQEAQSAQTELQARAAASAVLEAQRAEAIRRLEVLPDLQQELAGAKERLAQSISERNELALTLGRARFEKAELERKLDDLPFLRLQTQRAEENLELRKHLASGGRAKALDSRARLELEQDGSVRAVVPTTVQSKK